MTIPSPSPGTRTRQAHIRVEPSHHVSHCGRLVKPDDAAVECPTAAAANSEDARAHETFCEQPQFDDVELHEGSEGFVRCDRQCRQITASGWIDSLQ